MENGGTVDITKLVEAIRSGFVSFGTTFVFTSLCALPGMNWLAFPVVRNLAQAAIKAVINALSKATEMEIFFLNTALRKNSQAREFVEAVQFKEDLPENATKEEYEKAERAQITAFRNFVRLSN